MPNQIMITVLTLYNIDNTIFDKLVLPDYHFPRSNEYDDLFLIEGYSLDKQTLVDSILLECAELNTMYTNPDFIKYAIGVWCRRNFYMWRSLYETLFYKYNPIWNKDGTIKDSAVNHRTGNTTGTKSNSDTNITVDSIGENIGDIDNIWRSGNNTNIGTVNKSNKGNSTDTGNKVNVESESGENVNKVSAYDNAGFDNKDKTDISNNKTNVETNGNITNNSGEEHENNTEINNNSESENRKYTRNRNESRNSVNTGTTNFVDNTNNEENENNENMRVEKGNIGVVTTQKMIQEERELVQFNIYDFIVESFKENFCILVY